MPGVGDSAGVVEGVGEGAAGELDGCGVADLVAVGVGDAPTGGVLVGVIVGVGGGVDVGEGVGEGDGEGVITGGLTLTPVSTLPRIPIIK